MTLTRLSLSNPVAVTVAVILAVLFGALSLFRLPIQLTPEVERPEISITTEWRAAAPEEIEAEIIEPQEKVLRGLPGMTELLAKAQRGRGEITVKFAVGTNLERGLLEILNRLNRVARYPEDADEPVLSSIGGNSRAIAWFIIKATPGNTRDIASYEDFVEETVQTRFERVPGVALSEVRGGRAREVRITFDPYRAAALGVILPDVASLGGASKDISAGFADIGKRRYTVRFAGKYDIESLPEMVLTWRDGRPVRLRDVATVEARLVDRESFVIQNGQPAIAVNAHREGGVNVLEVMQGLRDAAKELGEGTLAQANLSIEQVYDETIYIDESIAMVGTNLATGVLLSIGVLWWFLRRFRATLMVALAIPASVMTSFVLLDALGRTLNVISLAGLAFAVGMVLDAAIVVLENIVRRRESGQDSYNAALQGTQEVWGALLASTATTVAIFLPVVFLQDEAGQLFADLALTIAVAIMFSLIVAVTVLPTTATTGLRNIVLVDPHARWWDMATARIMRATGTPAKRRIWIGVLLFVPLALTWILMPKPDYLPEGNRNLVFAFILPPPGANIEALEKELGSVIAERMQPYVDGTEEPQVSNYFFVAFSRGVFMGTRVVDSSRTNELVPLINRVIQGFPDTLAFAKRSSLFGGFGEGRTINVDIQGRDVESLLEAAQVGFTEIRNVIPGASVRPFPGLDLSEPELRLVPNEERLAEVGWTRQEIAGITRAFVDGLYIGDYFDGEERLDVILRSSSWETPEEFGAFPVATPDAGAQPLSQLMTIERTAGPDELRRIDRRRTITLQVTPPEGMPLGVALETIKTKVAPNMELLLPEDGQIRYTGTADQLQSVLPKMIESFVLAAVILYLLMSALFRSFRDSLLVILALPLATVGGVISLQALNLVMFQPMDVLTMIGFIILLGLVVNNAILLVHQTRAAEREGMPRTEAVTQAVRLRLRPILMSTLTSVFGMLPLLAFPGAGTELYKGLATVIIGGMLVSTMFTLLLLPCLLQLGAVRRA